MILAIDYVASVELFEGSETTLSEIPRQMTECSDNDMILLCYSMLGNLDDNIPIYK